MSQKELQRGSVISACIKGDMACARAAVLLCLSVRQVKRLKKRMREEGEAARAHASRGRPSHHLLPEKVAEHIVHLSRSTYAGFNNHHLFEKLVEQEGLSLSRETLRRLLRKKGIGSPSKRRAPAHRQRRLRSARLGELVQLDGSPHHWLEGRGPRVHSPEQVARSFQDHFGEYGKLFRVPGRVNLIGEHTDYNEGFVLPAAINLSCWMAPSPGASIGIGFVHFGIFRQRMMSPPDKHRN